ncbi:hypothetical protein [Pseudarthrobacter sp. NamE5]|uniref:hypothetical protein n=1 Tax=Pseudarthrobacter sp. NamE5 TaxID=2576839 RepID=UPI0014860803|nr:hypothetical protein [Pseudarthrobacter sp. NamE5]
MPVAVLARAGAAERAGTPAAPMAAPERTAEAVAVPASGAPPDRFSAHTEAASTPVAATARAAGRQNPLGLLASFPDTA